MLSENLKTRRKESGLTQAQAAEKLNVVRQTVSKWESGLSVPDANQLVAVSRLYGTDVKKLLDLEEKEDDTKMLLKLAEVKQEIETKNRRKRNFMKALLAMGILIFVWGAVSAGMGIYNYNQALGMQNYGDETLQIVLDSAVRAFQRGCIRMAVGGVLGLFAGITLRR